MPSQFPGLDALINSYRTAMSQNSPFQFGNVVTNPGGGSGFLNMLRGLGGDSPYLRRDAAGNIDYGQTFGGLANRYMTANPDSGMWVNEGRGNAAAGTPYNIEQIASGADLNRSVEPASTYGIPDKPMPPAGGPAPDTGRAGGDQRTATGGPGLNQFGNWRDATDYLMQGHDARNLQTEGMRGVGRAFNYDGIAYDPNAVQGWGRKDRTQGSRFDGGASWTGFVYRLNQLRQQRDGGGNQALGITGQTDDNTLARMAAQWVNNNYRGNTGFTIR